MAVVLPLGGAVRQGDLDLGRPRRPKSDTPEHNGHHGTHRGAEVQGSTPRVRQFQQVHNKK